MLICSEHKEVRTTGFFMGCPWEIIAWGPPDTAREAVQGGCKEIDRLESLLSRYRPESEISRINRLSGQGRISIHPEVCSILAMALKYAEATGGAFDPTAGVYGNFRGFGPRKPDTDLHGESLGRNKMGPMGYRHLLLEENSASLAFLRPGIQLDFGGIGKGYAVDRAVMIMKEHGIEQAWISCGSTGFGLGTPPRDDAWKIGIRDPWRRDRILRSVKIRDQAIATSGNNEQFVVSGGKRYGHICDPRTGEPAFGPVQVTVTSKTATEADMLSTAAFVLGTREGTKLLERWDGADACFIEERGGEIAMKKTPGWETGKSGRLNRRQFLAGLAATLGFFLLKPSLSRAEVYLTEEEALRRLLPEAQSYIPETVSLSDEQRQKVEELVGRKIEETGYRFYRGMSENFESPVGYAVVLDVIGKERPITFLAGVGPEGNALGLEVLIYRESQGSEIRSKRFMQQFIGKDLKAPLRLGRDIHGISGATLSSRSAAYAVKKALALVKVIYGTS